VRPWKPHGCVGRVQLPRLVICAEELTKVYHHRDFRRSTMFRFDHTDPASWKSLFHKILQHPSRSVGIYPIRYNLQTCRAGSRRATAMRIKFRNIMELPCLHACKRNTGGPI